jgi:hypothetical protein
VGQVIVLIVIVIVVLLVKAGASASSSNNYDRLVATGIPARGILLSVAPTGTKIGTLSRRFELRSVTIDVEIAGQAPYEIYATPVIPMNLVRDVLPGATVELRVDPKNPRQMAIVGPGTGFVQQALRTS